MRASLSLLYPNNSQKLIQRELKLNWLFTMHPIQIILTIPSYKNKLLTS